MKRQALIDMEKEIMQEVVRRRQLGGYNTDAATVLLLAESVYKLIGHILDESYPEEEPVAVIQKVEPQPNPATRVKGKYAKNQG